MEESENAKVWYVTREGEQYGPVSTEDLKYEAGRGELNPRLDRVWKEGMQDWIPAGEVEGLFKKNADAEAAERQKDAPPQAHNPQDEKADRYFEQRKDWEGTSRRGYIFICYILPVLAGLGIGFGFGFLEAKIGEKYLPLVLVVAMLVLLIMMISAILDRFRNLAMTRWWFLGLIVPLLNYWLGYRLFACPAGYAEHKRLGGPGWFLAVIYWVPMLAAVGFGVFSGIKGPDATQKMLEDTFTKMGVDLEELQENAREKESETSPN